MRTFTTARTMITVYYTWVPDNLTIALEEQWLDELPLEKQEALRRMRLPKARAASLLGLALLKHAMRSSGFADFKLGALRFPRGGKPYVDSAPDFNISHSKDMVVCALSTEWKIGIDTEKLRDIRIESFQRFLSARERAWVGGERRRFFELWTQKEAIVKGCGDGGLANLRRVTIEDNRGNCGGRTWMLRELPIHSDYVTHLAVERDCMSTDIPVEYLHVQA
jgi:4'-phosphopantetheinyl transferase